jgi:heme o synthase
MAPEGEAEAFMSGLRRLALGTAVATYLLIVVGAVVRTTGSGMGCGDDWPLCNGGFLPPLEAGPIVEWTHRLLGALVSPAILALVALAWLRARTVRDVVLPATAIPLLLGVQIGLGRVVVLLDLQTMVVMVHFVFALIILGLIVWVAVAADPANLPPSPLPEGKGIRGLGLLIALTLGATFLLVLVGAYVRASGAGWACIGFPDCNGQPLPFGRNRLVDLHLTHRLLAYLVTGLVFVTAWRARHLGEDGRRIRRTAFALAGLMLVQVGIGAVAVSFGPGALVQGAHVAGAAAVWAMAVALAAQTWMGGRGRRSGIAERNVAPAGRLKPGSRSPTPRQVAAAYFQLTKPRVMLLLLLTTLAAMLMAERGLPPLSLVFFTLLGGALAAGGAGAINHYLDRDVDELMGRTAARPIPAGLIPPRHALVFGIALGGLSFVVMVTFVNLLAASLSLLALLFYVFVYTCWLKRLTPANIVIGGAAGAVPPVVGMAAVTNEISPLAALLFTIIFVWTPPHFWALSLLMRRQYEAAGIPMLPIVSGDDETRRQILYYSLLMVAITVVVSWAGLLGSVYLVSAVVLGGLFIYYAVRLLREASAPAARRLFRYSMLYLALLFGAMVVDRQVVL